MQTHFFVVINANKRVKQKECKKMFICSSVFEDVDLNGVGTAVLIVLLAVMALVAVAINVVPRIVHKWEISYSTRDITYGATCLAIAYALSWAGLFRMPAGGTVTPGALAPIFLYCYFFGFRKGAVVTAAYTLLQLLQNPYIVSPWSAFFDYIFPYFSLCVVGLFRYNPQKYGAFVKRNKTEKGNGFAGAVKYWAYTVAGHWGIFAGAVIHMLLRYFSTSISSVLFFAYGAPPAEAFVTGLTYNSYALVDSAIAIAAVLLLLSSRTFGMFMAARFDDKKALVAAGDAPTAEAAAASDDVADQTDDSAKVDGVKTE